MRHMPAISSIVFLALPLFACTDADAGSAASIGSGSPASAVASSDGPPLFYLLSGPAKRFCSGIWVSERDRTEALYGSVLHSEDQVRDYESGSLAFDIDEERRIVTASQDGVSARARHFGDQGCVILPDATDGVFFTPRKVTSTLPDAESTPWPMGDMLPDEPLPEDVERGAARPGRARRSSPRATTGPPSWSSIAVASWLRATVPASTRTRSSRAGRWRRA